MPPSPDTTVFSETLNLRRLNKTLRRVIRTHNSVGMVIVVHMREHDEWLSILEKAFNERGYTTIREGKMFMEGRRWKIPDLFVLQNDQLVLVLEVIVTEDYPRILTKVKRIKEQYNPKHIVVFEPVKYLDENFLFPPKSPDS